MLKRLAVSFIIATMTAALFAAPASANHRWWEYSNSFNNFNANNQWHAIKIIEANPTHRAHFDYWVPIVLSDFNSMTSFSVYQNQNDSRPDVIIWATDESNLFPGSIAQVRCDKLAGGGKCHTWHLRLNEDVVFRNDGSIAPPFLGRGFQGLLCHEMMHTFGFTDFPSSKIHTTGGCSPQTSQGRNGFHLTDAEAEAISRYGQG